MPSLALLRRSPLWAVAVAKLLSGCLNNSPVVGSSEITDANAFYSRDSVPAKVDSIGIDLIDAGDTSRVLPLWSGRTGDMGKLPVHIGGKGEEFLVIVRGFASKQRLCYVEIFKGGKSLSRTETCGSLPPANAIGVSIGFGKDSAKVVSIGDIIDFSATVSSANGKLFRCFWSIDGNPALPGVPSIAPNGGRCEIEMDFPVAGSFRVRLKVQDDSGNGGEVVLPVGVLVDAPVADAGPDTTLAPKTHFHLRGTARDALGKVISDSWSGPIPRRSPDPAYESFYVAPDSEGAYPMVYRVEDDDANVTKDTVIVNVSSRGYRKTELASLSVSVGGLLPAFSPSIMEYDLRIPFDAGKITLVATAGRSEAMVRFDDGEAAEGSAAATISMTENRRMVKVRIRNGPADSTEYQLTVTRQDRSRMGYALVKNTGGTLSLISGYNSHGAAPQPSRIGTGRYRIVFPGLGSAGDSLVNVQVTPFADSQAVCSADTAEGGDFAIEVSCATTTGRKIEAGFSVTASWARPETTGQNVFAVFRPRYFKVDPATGTLPDWNNPFAPRFNSAGGSGPDLAVRQYLMVAATMAWSESQESPGFMDVAVTKRGDVPGFCTASNPFNSGKNAFVQVSCFEEREQPDSILRFSPALLPFSLSLNGPPGPAGDFDMASTSVKTDLYPARTESFSSTGGAVESGVLDSVSGWVPRHRPDGPDTLIGIRERGHYKVSFRGMGGNMDPMRRATAIVTATSGEAPGTCQIASMESDADLRFRVLCFNENGLRVNFPFHIRAIR